MTIQIKRGQSVNMPTLYDGQPGFAEDTEELYIGTPSGNVNVTKGRAIAEIVDEFNNLLAPTTLESLKNQSLDLNTLKIGYVDVKLAPITSDLIQRSINVQYPFGTTLVALKGDGTDETVNIQAFFTYANTKGNANLYFPDGTYCISNYIQVYKNTTVFFSANSIFRRIGSYFKMFANGTIGNLTYASGGYNGDGNIHFIGGTFDLNCQVGSTSPLTSDTTVTFFDLGHAENVTFDKITVKNGQIGHYFQISSMKNVRFKDCWFGAINYTGKGGTDYDYECIQVEVAQWDVASSTGSFPSFGSYDLSISRDIYVEDCIFDGVIRAFGTHSNAQYSTGSDIFCENINFINNRIFNSIHAGLHLTGFKYSTFSNNLIMNSGADGIQTLKVYDSTFEDNTIINPIKNGFYLDTTMNNKFNNNIIKDPSQSPTGNYRGFRLTSSNGNNFDGNTVTGTRYDYAFYVDVSDATNPNKIISHNFTKGTVATISGATSIDIGAYQLGDGQTVLMDSDLAATGNTFTFPHDVRNFNFLVIMGNNNSSATAQLVSYVLPKSAIIVGTSTSRYRLVTTDSSTANFVEFSFPSGTSIQVDTISGAFGHIRKVIGVC